MPNAMARDESLGRTSDELGLHSGKLMLAAAALLLLGLLAAPAPLDLAAMAAGATVATLAAAGIARAAWRQRRQAAQVRDMAVLTGKDPAPCLLTDAQGAVGFANAAARRRLGLAEGGSLVRALGDLFADPAGALDRLQRAAALQGGAQEDIVTRRGLVRLTVTQAGAARFLWRLEDVAYPGGAERAGQGPGLPMLIAAQSGAILFMNEAMRALVGGRLRHLDRVVRDLPLRPGDVHEVTTTDGPRRFRLVEAEGADGRRELYFLPGEGAGATAGELAASAGTEDLPVGLLELRADGVIVAANRIARELLRPEGESELAGMPMAERLEGLGRPVRDWLEEAAKGRGLGRPEVMRVRTSEAEAYLQVTLGRVAGRGGVRLVAVLHDATELKTLEAQFVQSQKMQAIGQLAGGVAHDFNNLLTAISGHCDLMLLRHDESDPDYGDLIQIHQNANRAAALVGQLLAFSRKQTLQPQVIDLRDTLSDLTHLLNRLVGERVGLRLDHEPGLPPVRADRRQLEQVIMNLVVNARDAMPEGGEIRIETATRILGEELRRDRASVPPGRYVVVRVEDHGIGIPADKLTKIFEPFYTSKRVGEGTGLGLSTAYGIVKQSGGYIFVDSVVGAGTVFTLYFPAHDQPADAAVPPARAPAARAGAPAPAADARRGFPADVRAQAPLAVSAAPAGSGPPRSAAPAPAPAPGDAQADPRPLAALPQPGSADAFARNLFAEDDDPAADAQGRPPAAAPAAKPADAPHPEARPAGAARRQGEGVVLLVEDEAPVRAFASRALRMRGYTVIEAENAEEALATLEDPALDVDLFVTDVIMPGMDGPTWVRQALRTRPGVKVVFVSGYAEDSFGEEQARIPNSIFLPKPFSLGELTATVEAQLH